MRQTQENSLKRAVALGRKIERFLIAVNGAQGYPYITTARGIEQTGEDRLAIEEWFCPVTARDLSTRAETAILIWDPAADEGFEILGRVQRIEERDYLNGYAPGTENGDAPSQVRRRLSIRAAGIFAISHSLRCEDIASMPHSETDGSPGEAPFLPHCAFAPEWAEHARFGREDEPCDDGRSGDSKPCPGGETQCVTGGP